MANISCAKEHNHYPSIALIDDLYIMPQCMVFNFFASILWHYYLTNPDIAVIAAILLGGLILQNDCPLYLFVFTILLKIGHAWFVLFLPKQGCLVFFEIFGWITFNSSRKSIHWQASYYLGCYDNGWQLSPTVPFGCAAILSIYCRKKLAP